MGNARRLGLIFPPAGRGVPEEGLAMYGERVEYLIECLGLETMTPAGYAAVQHRIAPAAERLAQRGAEAILLTGTSLTFFRGETYNRQLITEVRAASGLPATSMSTAVLDGLRQLGVTRIAAAGAQALLVSCGGLRTLEVLQPLEQRCGLPVVSSMPHALYAGARLLGIDARVDDHGRLLAS